MATAFMIRPGYAYGSNNEATVEDILDVAHSISIDKIRKKCKEYGLNNIVTKRTEQNDYLAAYTTVTRADISGDAIVLLASGGGVEREGKEIVRRAICLLILDECFRRGYTVSLEIN